MDIYQFKALLEKDKKFPINVFYGDEEFFINEACSAVKAYSLKDTDPSLSLVEFKGGETSGGVIFDELRTLPFFASKDKLVVVEEADDFVEKNRENLEKYLQTPASHASLVLICEYFSRFSR